MTVFFGVTAVKTSNLNMGETLLSEWASWYGKQFKLIYAVYTGYGLGK
jgi:hypothetical protein